MKLNLFEYSTPVRVWLLFMLYAIELTASLWVAYELRFDFMMEPAAQQERLLVLLWLVPLQLILLGLFHQLTPLLGYFSTPDLARMFHALFISSVITMIVWIAWGTGFAPPRGVIAMDFVFCLVGLTGVRLALRTLRESGTVSGARKGQRQRRGGINGRGCAGAPPANGS